MLRQMAVLIALGWTTSVADAQVNIERLRLADVEDGFGFIAGLDFTWRTGNVRHLRFDVMGRVDYDSDLLHAFAVGAGDFGWLDGDAFSSEALVHLREVLWPNNGLQWEFFQQANRDKSRLLTRRLLAGSGARIRLVQNQVATGWFAAGYMFESEQLDLPAGATHPDRTTNHRASGYISVRFGSGAVTALTWAGYLQPRLDDPSDYRAIGDLQFGVRIVGELSMVTSFLMRYDSGPPDGVVGLDTSFKTGFSFEW